MPTPYILNDNDALFFYRYTAKLPKDIVNRKSITDVALRLGITISFDSNDCKELSYERDHILIYDKSLGKNRLFFKHLRNAFAHLYIELSDDRCGKGGELITHVSDFGIEFNI